VTVSRRPEIAAMRVLDLVVVIGAVVAALVLVRHGPLDDGRDLIPEGTAATVFTVIGALLVGTGLALVPRRSPIALWGARGLCYSLALCLGLAALARHRAVTDLARDHGIAVWPPRPEDSRADRLETLTAANRVKWALRVAAHRIGYRHVPNTPIAIPAEWPFPADVRLATIDGDDGALHLWALAADGTSGCLRVPARIPPVSDTAIGRLQCEESQHPPASLAFGPVERVSWVLPDMTVGPPAHAWPQYRRTAAKAGFAESLPPATGGEWEVRLDDQARSTVAVVDSLVMVGSHGLGHVAVLRLADGHTLWRARAPNWVHMDPVTDGRTVLVGFGSDWGSFAGAEPSGVAAYELQTGAHRFTVFDESSVMTTPVVAGSTFVYVTAAGVMRKRMLSNGRLLAERRLPGGAIMAPPAMVHDTLVVSLDRNVVCAVLVSSFDRLWCRTMPGYRLMGHAAPEVADGRVIVSGVQLLRALSLREFLSLPRPVQLQLLTEPFGPADGYPGQGFLALRLRDGRVEWRSRAYHTTRIFKGHIAGTATVAGGVGAIVLPVSDTLVVFDPATGSVHWTAGAHGARGPPLLIGDAVMVAGRDGVVEVRALADGLLRCRHTQPGGYDRGGPVLAGGTVVFASLTGTIEALPLGSLVACPVKTAAAADSGRP
jgi:outer membrane protein assembly factor BamB